METSGPRGFILSLPSVPLALSPACAFTVLKKRPDVLVAFSRLAIRRVQRVCFCQIFQQRHKKKGSVPACVSLSCSLLCSGQNTEGAASGPRTAPFSGSSSVSQALEPVLGSQHLLRAPVSPESVAQSTDPRPKVLQLHTAHGCIEHLLVTLHAEMICLSPDD